MIESVHEHMTEFMVQELKLPNHSYDIPREKVVWFMSALSETDLDFEEQLQQELEQLSKEHIEQVKRSYAVGLTTMEGVPVRGNSVRYTHLENVILAAWVMNEFWAYRIMGPDDIRGIEFFSQIRLNYPSTYDLLLEWAWG